MVCVENTRASGYITEKIVNAFLAGAIPIYIGAPDIAAHFDPRSFVNCNELSLEECASEVRRIENNEELYQDMRNHPPFHDNRLNAAFSWHLDVPSEGDMWTVSRAMKNYLVSKKISETCDSDILQHTEVLSVPDISLLWRPHTESAMASFLEAEKVCPSASLPPVKSRFDVSCSITQPRRLQGFLGCEVGDAVYTDSEGTYSFVKGREIASLELASPTFGGNCMPVSQFGNRSNVWLLVPEGSSCHHSRSALIADESSSPNVRIGGLIVVQNADATSDPIQDDEVAGNLPWVSISKVDASWLHHELTRGMALELEITFKPKLHLLIDALLAAAQPTMGVLNDRDALSNRVACLRYALRLGPLIKRVNYAAAELCREMGQNVPANAFEARASQLML